MSKKAKQQEEEKMMMGSLIPLSHDEVVPHKLRKFPGQRKDYHQKLFKTPKETAIAIRDASIAKANVLWHRSLALGILAGIYVSFGAQFAINLAGGSPGISANNPGIQKLLFAIPFSTGLTIIVLFGAELFTGNTMFMAVGVLSRRVPFWRAFRNLLFSYFSNFLGCVLTAVFLAYFTQFWEKDPWHSYVKGLAVTKVEDFDAYVYFLRSIGANSLVCLAIYVAASAEDVISKIIGAMVPIIIFATIGFEHSVANMFIVTVSCLYGAPVNYGKFLYKNLLPVSAGNFLGGAVGVGFFLWYLYIIESKPQYKQAQYRHLRHHPNRLELALSWCNPTHWWHLIYIRVFHKNEIIEENENEIENGNGKGKGKTNNNVKNWIHTIWTFPMDEGKVNKRPQPQILWGDHHGDNDEDDSEPEECELGSAGGSSSNDDENKEKNKKMKMKKKKQKGNKNKDNKNKENGDMAKECSSGYSSDDESIDQSTNV